jgi:membrane fusion protein (multidrug efflux system)
MSELKRLAAWCSALALVAWLGGCDKTKATAAPPPPEVKVGIVLQRDVPVYVEAIGETRGNTEIEIRARVEGFVESVDYEEGSLVEKGQLLYTIDPKKFESAVTATKASQAEAEADLARARQDVADHQVELEILERRIEDFLHDRAQAVNLVDEQDVAGFQVGQHRR